MPEYKYSHIIKLLLIQLWATSTLLGYFIHGSPGNALGTPKGVPCNARVIRSYYKAHIDVIWVSNPFFSSLFMPLKRTAIQGCQKSSNFLFFKISKKLFHKDILPDALIES